MKTFIVKPNLYTALVGLHDRESCYSTKRNEVPNETYRYEAYRQFTGT